MLADLCDQAGAGKVYQVLYYCCDSWRAQVLARNLDVERERIQHLSDPIEGSAHTQFSLTEGFDQLYTR